MLEVEAKTKMCPLGFETVGTCIGSACMGWDHYLVDKINPNFVSGTIPTRDCPSNIMVERDPPEGDCGMKPFFECGA